VQVKNHPELEIRFVARTDTEIIVNPSYEQQPESHDGVWIFLEQPDDIPSEKDNNQELEHTPFSNLLAEDTSEPRESKLTFIVKHINSDEVLTLLVSSPSYIERFASEKQTDGIVSELDEEKEVSKSAQVGLLDEIGLDDICAAVGIFNPTNDERSVNEEDDNAEAGEDGYNKSKNEEHLSQDSDLKSHPTENENSHIEEKLIAGTQSSGHSPRLNGEITHDLLPEGAPTNTDPQDAISVVGPLQDEAREALLEEIGLDELCATVAMNANQQVGEEENDYPPEKEMNPQHVDTEQQESEEVKNKGSIQTQSQEELVKQETKSLLEFEEIQLANTGAQQQPEFNGFNNFTPQENSSIPQEISSSSIQNELEDIQPATEGSNLNIIESHETKQDEEMANELPQGEHESVAQSTSKMDEEMMEPHHPDSLVQSTDNNIILTTLDEKVEQEAEAKGFDYDNGLKEEVVQYELKMIMEPTPEPEPNGQTELSTKMDYGVSGHQPEADTSTINIEQSGQIQQMSDEEQLPKVEGSVKADESVSPAIVAHDDMLDDLVAMAELQHQTPNSQIPGTYQEPSFLFRNLELDPSEQDGTESNNLEEQKKEPENSGLTSPGLEKVIGKEVLLEELLAADLPEAKGRRQQTSSKKHRPERHPAGENPHPVVRDLSSPKGSGQKPRLRSNGGTPLRTGGSVGYLPLFYNHNSVLMDVDIEQADIPVGYFVKISSKYRKQPAGQPKRQFKQEECCICYGRQTPNVQPHSSQPKCRLNSPTADTSSASAASLTGLTTKHIVHCAKYPSKTSTNSKLVRESTEYSSKLKWSQRRNLIQKEKQLSWCQTVGHELTQLMKAATCVDKSEMRGLSWSATTATSGCATIVVCLNRSTGFQKKTSIATSAARDSTWPIGSRNLNLSMWNSIGSSLDSHLRVKKRKQLQRLEDSLKPTLMCELVKQRDLGL
jgi:hypothetical protein